MMEPHVPVSGFSGSWVPPCLCWERRPWYHLLCNLTSRVLCFFCSPCAERWTWREEQHVVRVPGKSWWWWCLVAKSRLMFCNPRDCSTPGFPVPHRLLEFAQVHVVWISHAIQPSHLLFSSSPPALSLSQHQGLFQWISCSHQLAKVIGASALASVLPKDIQGWFPLRLINLISLLSKGLSRVFSNTTVQKHLFFGA